MAPLETAFRKLYEYLEGEGYAWRAQSPERVRKLRESGDAERQAGRPVPLALEDPLTLLFGLGEERAPSRPTAALLESLPPGLARELDRALAGRWPAVSRVGDCFVAHDHWNAGGELAYLSQETYELLDRVPDPTGLRVLDLGSGAGGLALALSARAREVLGIEMNARAVEWARASAAAQGILNVRFEAGRIPDFSPGGKFDLAVFNPPMAIPESTPRSHRDGGKLGFEHPARFLDYAGEHLRLGGQACFLATSPVIGGRSVYQEQVLRDPRWSLLVAHRLHSRFNHSLARKAGYAALGIERIELWFFHLRKHG